ncbi:2-iminobutanoate/2-iminopropanoate deaminase [Nocardia sp. GAS34]|uniref:RidA family protein n=1 Tax=unclassified Nocardia TaxID=2637762 RepID=UPI003D1ECF8D
MSTTVIAQHPYSPAVVAGGFAFVSGALSVDENYVPVPGREAALDAAVQRTSERLATVGGTLADIVKLTYYVTDLSLREEANRQFLELFAAPRPARTFVEVSGLPYGATVEIDAIAQVRNGSTAAAG